MSECPSKFGMKTQQEAFDHVDLENGILYKALKQIRFINSNNVINGCPTLISVWCCEIEPSQTKALISIIRERVSPHDFDSLVHIKRISKGPSKSDPSKTVLKVIFSTSHYIETRAGVESFLNLVVVLDIYLVNLPQSAPQTKELSQKWSLEYWPMSWKGNPNHQFLNGVKFDILHERNLINKLVSQAQSTGCDQVLITYIAKQVPDLSIEITAIGLNLGSPNPYDHSVMKAIEKISMDERERRDHLSAKNNSSNYLCHNLLVYTTHEPCVMCCMALVHSRVGRVIYLRESPGTGGFESNYQLGDRDGLNWKFEIWKWVGKEADVISPSMINF